MKLITEQERRLNDQFRWGLGDDLCALLDDKTVTDIMLNPDGKIWIERLGKQPEEIGTMSSSRAEALMGTIAASLNRDINAENPLLDCEFPLDGSRFSACLPPVVSAPMFCIRKKALMVFTLQDYVEQGIMTDIQRAVIETAVLEKENIFIVGGTGTGKTTLTNAVINHITEACPNDRIVILEDTWELQCASKNIAQLRSSEQVSMTKLLKKTLRLNPDRIVVGEVRDGAALDLLDAWNTGHPGGVATLHANNAKAIFTRLQRLVSLAARDVPMQGLIAEAVDLIIYIEKAAGKRRIKEIFRVTGYEGKDYLTESIGGTNA